MRWREAIAAMRPTGEPCPGISSDKWPAIRDRALDFLEQHGVRAAELGWTAEDLFGVHPWLGTQRADYAGALVLNSEEPVESFDTDQMRRGWLTFHRTKPGRPTGVPIWKFSG
jgi:hypothetical protein